MNGLTLAEVLARVVLEGDSDFALSDGSSSEGEDEGFSAYHTQLELARCRESNSSEQSSQISNCWLQ